VFTVVILSATESVLFASILSKLDVTSNVLSSIIVSLPRVLIPVPEIKIFELLS
jgi:hypothetical protein